MERDALTKLRLASETGDVLIDVNGVALLRGHCRKDAKAMCSLGSGFFVEATLDQAIERLERYAKLIPKDEPPPPKIETPQQLPEPEQEPEQPKKRSLFAQRMQNRMRG